MSARNSDSANPVGYVSRSTIKTLGNIAGRSDTFLHIYAGKKNGWNDIPLYLASPPAKEVEITDDMVERAARRLYEGARSRVGAKPDGTTIMPAFDDREASLIERDKTEARAALTDALTNRTADDEISL